MRISQTKLFTSILTWGIRPVTSEERLKPPRAQCATFGVLEAYQFRDTCDTLACELPTLTMVDYRSSKQNGHLRIDGGHPHVPCPDGNPRQSG